MARSADSAQRSKSHGEPSSETVSLLFDNAMRIAMLSSLLCSAYQGFASGSLERDAAAVRLFADAGLELLLAQVLC